MEDRKAAGGGHEGSNVAVPLSAVTRVGLPVGVSDVGPDVARPHVWKLCRAGGRCKCRLRPLDVVVARLVKGFDIISCLRHCGEQAVPTDKASGRPELAPICCSRRFLFSVSVCSVWRWFAVWPPFLIACRLRLVLRQWPRRCYWLVHQYNPR